MDKQNEVLLNTFVISKKKYRVFYNAGVLVWEAENSKKEKTTVPIGDIISANLSTTASGRSSSKPNANNIATTYGTTSNTHAPMNESIDYDRIPVLPTSSSTTTNATINTMTTTTNLSNRVNSYDILNSECEDDNYGNANYLIIHYARLVSPRTCKWRVQQISLYNSEQRIIKFWHSRLTEDIKEQARPKNVLMFLNPYGGKQNAFALFEKYAKPLFHLAHVDINLIITQRAQQIYDIMTSQTINLSNYDGVVCCGGDGTFAELFNGLVYRTMIDLDMDINCPPYLPKPSIPIGVIPAGSTDTVAYCLNGSTDIKSSIIHIILGQSTGLDISSVYRNSQNGDQPQLLKLYASVMSYGFLGDVAMDSENYRWMGPKRYDYSGVKKFLRNRGYNVDVTVQIEKGEIDGVRVDKNNPHDGVRCLENCQRCQLAATKDHCNDAVDCCDTEEVTVRGKFLMVNGANISCACHRSPQGFNPNCHLGDGYLDLIFVRHTSLFNNIRLLLAMSSKTKKISDLPFVEIYRTKQFKFNNQGQGHENSGQQLDDDLNQTTSTTASSTPKANGNNGTAGTSNGTNGTVPKQLANNKKLLSKWNCDGEILLDTDVTVKCNCQLITVFRRGISCRDGNCMDNEANILNCCGLCK